MQKKDSVLYVEKDSIGTVILNRPGAKNTIDNRTIVQMKEILEEIDLSEDLRVVLITGVGEDWFCGGTDSSDPVFTEKKNGWMAYLSLASYVQNLDRPTVAVINGDAFGQGLELALACDLRICVETARFCMSQITHGDMPWDGGTQRLSRVVGRGDAMELILTGRTIDALEARRIGLVNRITPAAELIATARVLAQELASKAPLALRYIKEAVYQGNDMTIDQGLRLEADLYALLHTTQDRSEGIKAFIAKRSARFKGD